jgi:hypothetical protein
MASKDSLGCLAAAASLLFLIGLFGLVWARSRDHHEAFYWVRVRVLIPSWFNPWQGIVLSLLVLAFSIYALVLAVRARRK